MINNTLNVDNDIDSTNTKRRGRLNVEFDTLEVEICTIKFGHIDLSKYITDTYTNDPTTPGAELITTNENSQH